MHSLGTDQGGRQDFTRRHDGCTRRSVRVHRWWESRTDFHTEDVGSHEPKVR
jgi:hypothetical protein